MGHFLGDHLHRVVVGQVLLQQKVERLADAGGLNSLHIISSIKNENGESAQPDLRRIATCYGSIIIFFNQNRKGRFLQKTTKKFGKNRLCNGEPGFGTIIVAEFRLNQIREEEGNAPKR